MNVPVRIAAVLAVVVLAVGGAFFLSRPGQSTVRGPSVTPGASPAAVPSTSPTMSPSASAAAAPTWTATGAMTEARAYLDLVTLADGRILAVGGDGGTGSVASADPTTRAAGRGRPPGP